MNLSERNPQVAGARKTMAGRVLRERSFEEGLKLYDTVLEGFDGC